MKKTFFFLLWTGLVMAVVNPPNRTSNAPYISGDAFRAYADYCYDELSSNLDPTTIQARSTIFVKTDYMDQFVEKVHPLIEVPYILITHNSDDPTPGPFTQILDDDKLIAWFAQNFDGFSHEKLYPIPMGIANYCWPHGNSKKIKKVRDKNYQKKHLAHMQINPDTFPEERKAVFEKFSNEPYCFTHKRKPFQKFLKNIATAKFEIAPRGHALDTHRIWESMYLGTIPIVKTSSLDALYQDLPILIIQSWDEVNEAFLNQKYGEFQLKSFDTEKIYMDYWINLIDSLK